MSVGKWTRRRGPVVALAVGAVLLTGVLAFGVFGVHTLLVDDVADEAAPTFRSGAAAGAQGAGGDGPDETSPSAPVGSGEPEAPAAAAAPQVTEAARGTFTAQDHPGRGTVVILTDGTQSFVRFEDDFATDNGPDLYATVYVRGELVELAKLKGNQGSQNYELPASIDPDDVEAVAVWCKRFDSTFTIASLR